MKNALLLGAALACVTAVVTSANQSGVPPGLILEGKRLFESETFGGNGRTCQTCHSAGDGNGFARGCPEAIRTEPGRSALPP